ncbi:MAG: lipid-binding SYLF domain-containing protein [Desulfobulbaceae bacterium]|nr:lipid-binding SYLF domain-containing protein [Desulfobulbaceae bacterium]HIJ78033.1 lipid-binding SYLF domain-containing protein [Deltaproteobacteria bacterium]
MNKFLIILGSIFLAMTMFFSPASSLAYTTEEETVQEASGVLAAINRIPEEGIPPVLLRQAQAIAVFPGTVKAGFMLAGRFGQGIMLGRDDNGNWGLPFFVELVGGSMGWQFGLQSTDIILVFKTKKGLLAVRDGKITLGADVDIAAGPVGRHFEAATDLKLKAEVYSYSRSKGIFAGLALGGSMIRANREATEALYGKNAEAISRESIAMPACVAMFYQVLNSLQIQAPQE